jgi:methyl-accepting chemotaxis protein
MKIRVSISASIILFGVVTGCGLATILSVTDYANKQLRVGGPLYSQIKLGNDLVADILPPPEYVVEAYLETTLALRAPSKLAAHELQIRRLHKDYDERRDYWIKSDIDRALKDKLTIKSDAEVQKFWSITEKELLPALARNDIASAEKSYAQLDVVYGRHRAIIDDIVQQVNTENSQLEVAAADRVTAFALIVWIVSGVVVTIIASGILGIALGVIRPIVRITAAMKQMSQGDLDVVIPGMDRADEIGSMAKAIGIIRDNAERNARSEADAKVEQNRIAAEHHRREMEQLADDFEGAVGKIIETVSLASTELEASAGVLTKSAESAQELSGLVSTASEEASANVQSVASASEEMSSSVNEIGRQVQESARIASNAVTQAQKTDNRVNELSQAATRIGDVVELINTIAGQTNLLALNATIEAARAGEAGRGFAVVASEVKALAEQTAKATGEISVQIAGIQAATHDSVNAIKEISGTIDQISEISSTIASAVEEQGAATQEISRNIQRAAQGTQRVSSNIADVQRGALETQSASSQVLSSAQSLSKESSRLKLEVGKFLDMVRAA